METNIKLYTLSFRGLTTYLCATIFVACNIVLPHLAHLVPQGGIIFAPLSMVIMAGAYKFGWRTGLIAALASPLANHLITGLPAQSMLPLMTAKLLIIAVIAGLVAQKYRKASLLLLIGVALSSLLLGGIAELALTGGIQLAVNDLLIGWPGLLLQVGATWLVANKLNIDN